MRPRLRAAANALCTPPSKTTPVGSEARAFVICTRFIKVPREDVNWAHEILKEIDKRIRSDVCSLNTDTTDGVLSQLTDRYGVAGGQPGRVWQPLDNEKPLADYIPPAEVPNVAEVRAALVVPETPEETPFAALLLERIARIDLDPWAVELPPQDPTP